MIHPSTLTIRATLVGAFSLLAQPILHATQAAGPTPTLFMGVDLSVLVGGKTGTLQDMQGDTLVISGPAGVVQVPTTNKNLQMQIKHSLKLADNAAMVDGLITDRAYTPANDPHRRFMASAAGASANEAAVDIAMADYGSASTAYTAATQAVIAGAPGAEAAQATAGAWQDSALSQVANNTVMSAAGMGSTLAASQQLADELALENFDALDVTFSVSSPEPLSSPYVVVIAEYRERDARPGNSKNWIVTRAIGPVDAKPRKVRILQGGFPVGFQLDRCQVHLFNKGQEIATNVAPMRTALSPDEAFEFRVIDYISNHKDETLPASPAPEGMSSALRERMLQLYPDKPIYVRVKPTGRAERVCSDKACTKPIEDALLSEMLMAARYNPALAKGKPVAGVAMLVASTKK